MTSDRKRRARRIHLNSWLAALAVSALVFSLTACGNGGGASSPPPPVNNPIPSLTGLSVTSATAGGPGFTLTVGGSNFISSSVVNWNNSARPTNFQDSSHLTASIFASDIATVGNAQVTVSNPAPGGGTSSQLPFSIVGPGPTISSLSPGCATAVGSGFNLMVGGSNFISSSVVNWNNSARPTNFQDSSHLAASIPASDIAAAGNAQVTVSNPAPGGGSSSPLTFYVNGPGTSICPLYLATADIVYDSVGNDRFGKLIYASVPASASSRANTITPIDPVAGTIGTSVLIGDDPGDLAISADGSFLYIGLNGAAAVQRFNVPLQTPDIRINLGSGVFGPMYAEDLEVMQDNPRSFAVARKFLGQSPRNAGVAVFDEAVPRATTTPAGTSPNVIQLCSSPSVLFGLNVGDGVSPRFYKLSVDASGVTVTATSTDTSISGSDFSFGITPVGERIFSTSGQVLAVSTLTVEHTFPATGLVKADATAGRVFFLTQSSPGSTTWNILAFNINTNTLSDVPTGTLAIPGVNGNPGSLIRWGTNGLAFRTEGQVFLITSPFVAGL